MKKFLALALALVMALALAAPAMAFTNDVADEYEYTLGIELVEWENDAFFGIVGAAPSDRGYAKNEIVAFIITYTAEKGGKADTYNYLKVTGNNVNFDVTENPKYSVGFATVTEDELTANIAIDATKLAKANQTVKLLGFAKVTGDDASITAELTAAAGTAGDAKFKAAATGTELNFKDGDDTYKVMHKGNWFGVEKNGDAAGLFEIVVDKDGKSKALLVKGDEVLVNNAGQYIFVHATTADVLPGVKAQKALYEQLVGIVEDEFEGVFGFDYDLLGGLVTEKSFESIVTYDKLSVTVDIAPWVAYVQVPDVIVVDPPKTGDATVLVGIVMAIVAAAGVVVFNKVRA